MLILGCGNGWHNLQCLWEVLGEFKVFRGFESPMVDFDKYLMFGVSDGDLDNYIRSVMSNLC